MYVFAAKLAVAERDGAVGKREQRVVLADTDVAARVPLRATLTNDDVAGARLLAAEELYAQALAFTVATVAAGAACFFMCHDELLRFRCLLGCGLSGCSIICRRGLGFFRLRLGGLGRCFGFGSLLCLRRCSSLRRFGRSRFRLRDRLGGLGLLAADRHDLQDRVLLAMALLAAIIVAAALLEDGDLLAFRLGDDLGRDLEAVGLLEVGPVAGKQDVAQSDAVAGFPSELLNDDLVSGGDAILLTARAHDCEHWFISLVKLDAQLSISPRAKGRRLWQAVQPVNRVSRGMAMLPTRNRRATEL